MNTTPPLDLLAMFIAVADERSFTRAASRLRVTPGTVSRGIARLESELHAELLHRNTHRVALSTAGTALYERTAPHVAALTQSVGRLPERDAAPSGELRVTAPYDLGVTLLPDLVAAFALRYPAVHVDVRLTNRQVDLVGEGFDLAIRVATKPLKDSSVVVRRIGATEVRSYASPAYVARRGDPSAAWSSDHEWLIYGPMRARLPANLQPRLASDDLLFLREAARAGMGIATLPWFLGEPYVSTGALVAVLPRPRRRGGGFVLLYPAKRQLPRKVTAFRDFLIDGFARGPLGPA